MIDWKYEWMKEWNEWVGLEKWIGWMDRIEYNGYNTLLGIGQYTDLSSRPGLNKAGSISPGRLVAAKMYTPSKPSTPSSCVNSWLTTRSVTPVLSWPRRGARESNSSKNKIHGLAVWALRTKVKYIYFILGELVLFFPEERASYSWSSCCQNKTRYPNFSGHGLKLPQFSWGWVEVALYSPRRVVYCIHILLGMGIWHPILSGEQ